MGTIAKLNKLLPTAILITSFLFFIMPFTIYFGNHWEFSCSFIEILSSLAFPGISFFAGYLVLGLICSKKINYYIAAGFAIGLLCWFQSNFLFWDYGVFDGRGINWQSYTWQGWLDISIWVVTLAGIVFFSDKVNKISPVLSLFFVGFQILVISLQWFNAEARVWQKSPKIVTEIPQEVVDYSSSKNIIHIILDSFQTDIFIELIEEEGYKDELTGFVLFKENLAVFPHTSLSIPAIFSGKVFDGKVSFEKYSKEAIQNGFQNVLFDKGYVVNLIPEALRAADMHTSKYTNYYQPSHQYGLALNEIIYDSTLRLLNISFFKSTPHFFRKYLFNEGNWRFSNVSSTPFAEISFQVKEFFTDYIHDMKKGNPGPSYHFIHLWPPHPPYVTDNEGKYAGRILERNRTNYKNEAKDILKLFMAYLKKLKQMEIYDSSLIILQGDHGSNIKPLINGVEIDLEVKRVAALLTIKRPGDQAVFKLSTAKTTLSDIPATVMDILKIKHQYGGYSVFKLDETKDRKREFGICYEPHTKLTKYLVDGSIFDPTKWKKLGVYEVNTENSVSVQRKVDKFKK